MTIDYLVSINTRKQSGKSKATKEKIKYLCRSKYSVRVFTLDSLKFINHSAISAFFIELVYLFRAFFTKKADLVFTRSLYMFGTFFIGKIFGIPVIREVHADFDDESKVLYKKNGIKLFLSRLYNNYEMYFLKRSDGVIFNNSILENHYKIVKNIGKVNTIAISNGTDPELFYPIDIDTAKKKLGLDSNKKYLLFIGSISIWHGVNHIIETFKELREKRQDLALLIVGGDKHTLYKLQNKIRYQERDIIYTGMVQTVDAKYYINAATLCLLPVNNIRVSPGSPLKLFDYAACGKPIACQRDCVGYSDIVEKYNLGISCDFKDSKSTAKQIGLFLDKINKVDYVSNNRKVILRYYTWEKILDQWIEFGKKVAR